MGDPRVEGRWTPVFSLPNVPVHVSLLPNGKVLHWGRRKDPSKNPSDEDLDEHFTKSFLWTPPPDPQASPVNGRLGASEAIKDKNEPTYLSPWNEKKENQPVNLFCSGHCLMPDGNLLAVGGHWSDGYGVEQACIFDYEAEKWISQPVMANGRWYPSVAGLPDGRVLCVSGSYTDANNPNVNSIPQIFSMGGSTSSAASVSAPIAAWTEVQETCRQGLVLELYPRLHIDPHNGQVFMTGPKPGSWYLGIKKGAEAHLGDVKTEQGVVGTWTRAGTSRAGGVREYACSVMYASGKIMYIGGGAQNDDTVAGRATEFIDLNQRPPTWEKKTVDLNYRRKQFNATILPDGAVLVTGGTSRGFNDLDTKSIVRRAELMDPSAKERQWVEMAEEAKSRCYHSTALLLPCGRVLSAGGGEYGGCNADECHSDAQLFEPPYLFQGPRPTITSNPSDIKIEYRKEFLVNVGSGDSVGRVNLVRLGSVTHCNNFSQQLVSLDILGIDGPIITVKAPDSPNIAPPGYYMLFVLNRSKVPSVGSIVHIAPIPMIQGDTPPASPVLEQSNVPYAEEQITQTTPEKHEQQIMKDQDRPLTTVGLTPICPYGLGPCWGGAYEGLQAVLDIDTVLFRPDNKYCLAFVYLKQDILPDLDIWREQFKQVANKAYHMRGIEMTLHGAVSKGSYGAEGQLILAGTSTRPEVTLAPFQARSQLRWDIKLKGPTPMDDKEANAYNRLVAELSDHSAGANMKVTGTLQKQGNGKFSLDVRDFATLDFTNGVGE